MPEELRRKAEGWRLHLHGLILERAENDEKLYKRLGVFAIGL
jgi:hypothetical protein